jgi:hypothetical protein
LVPPAFALAKMEVFDQLCVSVKMKWEEFYEYWLLGYHADIQQDKKEETQINKPYCLKQEEKLECTPTEPVVLTFHTTNSKHSNLQRETKEERVRSFNLPLPSFF